MPWRLTRIDLPPDAFAVVMATGIVSVAARQHHYPIVGDVLAAIAVALFVLLAAGLVVRVSARFASAVREIQDPDVAFRMFTATAACTVLGVRFQDDAILLDALASAAAVSWLLLVPLALRDVARRPRRELRDHAHGAWLLPSVATSGLAITAVDLGHHHSSGALFWLAAALWLVALVVYGSVTWLLAWRSVVAPLRPELVTPDSWILLGALAIATLASSRLLNAARDIAFDAWLVDALRPATLVLWCLASAWAPLLLYGELWLLEHRSGALHYAGVWWSAVFPLGMYSSATASASAALDIHALYTVSLVVFWVAVTVWLVVATGWTHRAARRIRAATR